MAAEIAVDSFWNLLRQSGLVSEDQMLALMMDSSGEAVKSDSSRNLADELIKRGILTQWQADMLLQGKHRGFHLGPHRILRPLGQGGMSKVFLAEHEMMHRRCAIKVLPSKYQEDPDLLSRFHLEARAIAALDHPHIVRAYDFNKDVRYGKEIHYLVMEYIEGQDLRRMVEEQGPLEYRKAADFICQAAEGLAHAHQAGFVHRDIKPANLLVDPSGVLKILDLGLARFTFEGEQAWQALDGEQSTVGTADYVAPEQVMDSRNVDGRADVYSLGHTFYFLLTGRRPFPKATLVELLMAHRTENPEPLGKFRPDVPPELAEIIERMTVKKPIQRYQTAREVTEALHAFLMRESAGGSEYSRISALMAAAMRAKQFSDSDSAPAKSESAEDEELELALLDDEPSRYVDPAEGKIAESSRTDLAKAAVAAAKNRERKSVGSDSGVSRTEKLPDLMDEKLVHGSSSDPRMTAAADRGWFPPIVRPWIKQSGGMEAVLTSLWLWIGLVALLLMVIIVLLFLVMTREPADYSSIGTAVERVYQPHPAPPLAPPTPRTRPAKPPEAVAPPKKPDKASPPRKFQKSPRPAVKPSPPSRPADKPKPPVTAPPPKLKEKPAAPPPPEKPPADEAVDVNKLLADSTAIVFRLRSSESDPKSVLNSIVSRRVLNVAKQLGIKVEESGATVMEINLKTSNIADFFTVFMSAELKCTTAGGQVVTVWKHDDQVISLRLYKVRSGQAAWRVAKVGVSRFFKQFVDDVHRARSKVRSGK